MTPIYPAVLVTWVDAAHFQGWGDIDTAKSVKPKQCVSLGFQLPGGKDFIRLAQSLSGVGTEDEQLADILAIPKVWVKRIRKV